MSDLTEKYRNARHLHESNAGEIEAGVAFWDLLSDIVNRIEPEQKADKSRPLSAFEQALIADRDAARSERDELRARINKTGSMLKDEAARAVAVVAEQRDAARSELGSLNERAINLESLLDGATKRASILEGRVADLEAQIVVWRGKVEAIEIDRNDAKEQLGLYKRDRAEMLRELESKVTEIGELQKVLRNMEQAG